MKDMKWLVGDKYSLSVLLDSSNSVEKLCDEWVLSTSVWGACICVSISTHTATHSTSESAHDTQTFLAKLRKQKIWPPPALQTTKNFLLTTKNDSAIFSCKQRTNAMNRTKHHKLHAFQRAVGWCETVCNLCCHPLRAVYRKLLKRVSITGFPVIENLIADSDIKDRTERSP